MECKNGLVGIGLDGFLLVLSRLGLTVGSTLCQDEQSKREQGVINFQKHPVANWADPGLTIGLKH
jgi:hypothetical protein